MKAEVTPAKLSELARLPFGEAAKWIRKNVDPIWGLAPGATTDFVVVLEGSLKRTEDFKGEITVSAADEKNAEKLAFAILDASDPQRQFKWDGGNPLLEDWDDEDWNVVSVKSP